MSIPEPGDVCHCDLCEEIIPYCDNCDSELSEADEWAYCPYCGKEIT